MCGIAGIISRNGSDRAVHVARMLQIQAHRGPDGSAVWESPFEPVTLGHRRLAILDLTQDGAQPMIDVEAQLAITYNGEIYNYLELRVELLRAGLTFRTQSDTEVLLAAYRRWGPDCLQRLNGMFAFAIHDRRSGTLFCARDRFGEKPFLYACVDDTFIFASEFKAILLHPNVPLEVDDWRLMRAAHSQSSGLDSDRETVFKGVMQLLPGEAMEVNVQSLKQRVWRYWTPNGDESQFGGLDEHEVTKQFQALLVDSVRIRLRSDVTVGSCLSGGLDSSAIVCIVRKLLGSDAPYHTFTGRFPGTSSDEWSHASRVIEATKVVSHVTEPTPEAFVRDLPKFIWHNELPVGSSSQYAQWCVFELARTRGVTVLLDGQGADEMLGGYEQYFAFYVQALKESGDVGRLERELPQIRNRYPLALSPSRRRVRDSVPFRLRHWLSNNLNFGTDLLYGVEVDSALSLKIENAVVRDSHLNPLSNALTSDTFSRFLPTLLRYGDRNSMAHSREVRLPFCDHRLAEFALALPPHFLMGGAQTKRLLRESMRGVLPEEIRTRWNKQGFRPPQHLWFRSAPFIELARRTLDSASFRESPYWNHVWWSRALERMEKGEVGLAWVLWPPLITELWRTHYVNVIRDLRRGSSVKGSVACA